MAIDPQAQIVLDLLPAVGFTFGGADPAALRESMAAGNTSSPIELAEITDRTIPGPGGEIPVRIYRPSTEPVLPVGTSLRWSPTCPARSTMSRSSSRR